MVSCAVPEGWQHVRRDGSWMLTLFLSLRVTCSERGKRILLLNTAVGFGYACTQQQLHDTQQLVLACSHVL